MGYGPRVFSAFWDDHNHDQCGSDYEGDLHSAFFHVYIVILCVYIYIYILKLIWITGVPTPWFAGAAGVQVIRRSYKDARSLSSCFFMCILINLNEYVNPTLYTHVCVVLGCCVSLVWIVLAGCFDTCLSLASLLVSLLENSWPDVCALVSIVSGLVSLLRHC